MTDVIFETDCGTRADFPISVSFNKALNHTGEQVSLLIVKSATKLILGKRLYTLNPGDALLALPFSYLRQTEEMTGFCGYMLEFSINTLREFMPKLYFRCADGGGAISFSEDTKERLLSFAASLPEEADLAFYAATQIFTILEQEALPQTEALLSCPIPGVLRRALAHLEENAFEEINASRLAARYDVSHSTLRRLFHTYLATTPSKYAKEMRGLRAARYEKNEVK